jgi:hypothetical protein
MNDIQPCCESRAEDISLLAAGCLTDREERELREHFTKCEACLKRFEEMASVCIELLNVRPDMDSSFEHSIVRIQQIELWPSTAKAWNRGDVRIVISMLTACVLLFAAVHFFAGWPEGGGSQQLVKVVPEVPHEGEKKSAPLPTILALSRAAAESDEALDRLLADCSAFSVSNFVNTRMNYQELLR